LQTFFFSACFVTFPASEDKG